jgi:hypothetical protein
VYKKISFEDSFTTFIKLALGEKSQFTLSCDLKRQMNDDKNMEMDIKYSALFVPIVSIACERFFCVCFHTQDMQIISRARKKTYKQCRIYGIIRNSIIVM